MRPVMMTWTQDQTMVPHTRFLTLCDRQFVVGADYPMQVVEPRSMKSHNHYFASLNEMFENLPEAVAKRWPTIEHLRAWALVHTGFYTEKDYACDNESKAKYLAKIIRAHSEYAVIKISGDVVKVLDPKSQSIAAMGNDEFKESKEKVLDLVASLNPGLSRSAVAKQADKVAPREKEHRPATKPAPAATPQPASAPAYFAYARSWIFGTTDRAAALARWETERDLRDRLKVSIPNRRELEKLLDDQFKEEVR